MNSTVLWVTAGRGPIECMEAAVKVAREIEREAAEAGLSSATSLERGQASAKSIAVAVGGEGHETFADGWEGTVRWTERSPRRGTSSRKNWFVAVRKGEEAPEARSLPDAEVRYETMRAGGPGGQHQNVTDSAVRAVHIPTGISAICRDGRSQRQNKKAALQRLEEALAARDEMEKEAAARRGWLARIEVERGNERRTYEGGRLKV